MCRCGPTSPIRPGSPGKPQRGRRVAVLPVEGGTTPLLPGEVGLLAVHRSDPGLMLGYWRRPEEEDAARRGEWFLGGDLAEFDADGYVWHRGRNNDLMNAFGYRVSPLEVEKALAAHPAVADVAVAERKVSDEVSVIAAFVVPRPGTPPAEDALLAHAAERLALYKRPRAIVFVSELPHAQRQNRPQASAGTPPRGPGARFDAPSRFQGVRRQNINLSRLFIL